MEFKQSDSALKNLETLINSKRTTPIDISEYDILTIDTNTTNSRNTKLVLQHKTTRKKINLYYNRIDIDNVYNSLYSKSTLLYKKHDYPTVDNDSIKPLIISKLAMHGDSIDCQVDQIDNVHYQATITPKNQSIIYTGSTVVKLEEWSPILPGWQYPAGDE